MNQSHAIRLYANIKAFLDLSSKINAMTLAFVLKLNFGVYYIDIRAPKIPGYISKTFKIVFASYQVKKKLGHIQYFQKTFLLNDISIEIMLKMTFLVFSSVKIPFVEKKITQQFYTLAKTFTTTKQVELINKNKFTKIALNQKSSIFMIYVKA